MSTLRQPIADVDLEEIPSPYAEPRLAFQALEPRKVNNLTLVDGKTFLSTTVAGDIMPAGAPMSASSTTTRASSACWSCASAAAAP